MKLCGLVIVMLFLTACPGPVLPPPAPDSIEGTLIDGRTHAARAGRVTLQQPDGRGFLRIVRETNSDVRGRFSFMSVPAGSYLLLAVSYTQDAPDHFVATAPSALFISPGTRVEDLPLFPIGQTGTSDTISILTGDVETDTVSSDVTLSAFSPFFCAPGSSCPFNALATIPVGPQGLSPRGPNITTQLGGPTCRPGAACGTYEVMVPTANIAFVVSPNRNSPFVQPTAPPQYVLEAFPTSRGTSNPNCTPQRNTTQGLDAVPGPNPPLGLVGFLSCQ